MLLMFILVATELVLLLLTAARLFLYRADGGWRSQLRTWKLPSFGGHWSNYEIRDELDRLKIEAGAGDGSSRVIFLASLGIVVPAWILGVALASWDWLISSVVCLLFVNTLGLGGDIALSLYRRGKNEEKLTAWWQGLSDQERSKYVDRISKAKAKRERELQSHVASASAMKAKLAPEEAPEEAPEPRPARRLSRCRHCKGHGGWGGLYSPFTRCPYCNGSGMETGPMDLEAQKFIASLIKKRRAR